MLWFSSEKCVVQAMGDLRLLTMAGRAPWASEAPWRAGVAPVAARPTPPWRADVAERPGRVVLRPRAVLPLAETRSRTSTPRPSVAPTRTEPVVVARPL